MLNQQEQCLGKKIDTDQMSSRMASLIIPIQPANLSKIKSCHLWLEGVFGIKHIAFIV